jgi:hypothetical protein
VTGRRISGTGALDLKKGSVIQLIGIFDGTLTEHILIEG